MGQDEKTISQFSVTVAVTVVAGLVDLFEMPNGDVVKLGGFERHILVSP